MSSLGRSAVLMILSAAAIASLSQEPAPLVDYERLRWERDFELILEIGDVPTRGQEELENSIALLEKEKDSLVKKKERLASRLERLNTTYSSDELYDEMLEEETTDLSATKESISTKLAAVEERLDNIESRLRKLYPERRK